MAKSTDWANFYKFTFALSLFMLQGILHVHGGYFMKKQVLSTVSLIALIGLLSGCVNTTSVLETSSFNSSSSAEISSSDAISSSSAKKKTALEKIQDIVNTAASKRNFSVHDRDYEAGVNDVYTSQYVYFGSNNSGEMLLNKRAYYYSIDEGKVSKGTYDSTITSLDSLSSSLDDFMVNFSAYDFAVSADDASIYESSDETAISLLLTLDQYVDKTAASVQLSASDDGSLTVSFIGFADIPSEDDALRLDDASSKHSFVISNVGKSENTTVKEYISSYDGLAYSSYLTSELVATLKQDLKATCTYTEDDVTTKTETIINAAGYSYKAYQDNVLGKSVCVVKGDDTYGYIESISYKNTIALTSTGSEFDSPLGYKFFDHLLLNYFGTADNGATYTMLDPCDEVTTLIQSLTGFYYQSFLSVTLKISDSKITEIDYSFPSSSDDTVSVNAVITFSELGTAIADTISVYPASTTNDDLKAAIKELSENNYAVDFHNTNNDGEVISQGKYVVDRKNKMYVRTLVSTIEKDDGTSYENIAITGGYYGTDKFSYFTVATINSAASLVTSGYEEYSTEEGETIGQFSSTMPGFDISSDLFTKDGNTYTFKSEGVIACALGTFDFLTGFGDNTNSLNNGFTVTLDDTTKKISKITYNYDNFSMGFDTGVMECVVSEIGTVVNPYANKVPHVPTCWEEEGIVNNGENSTFASLKAKTAKYDEIPYFFGGFSTGGWTYLNNDEATDGSFTLLSAIEEGITVDYFKLLTDKGYTLDTTYTNSDNPDQIKQYKSADFTILADVSDGVTLHVTPTAA